MNFNDKAKDWRLKTWRLRMCSGEEEKDYDLRLIEMNSTIFGNLFNV